MESSDRGSLLARGHLPPFIFVLLLLLLGKQIPVYVFWSGRSKTLLLRVCLPLALWNDDIMCLHVKSIRLEVLRSELPKVELQRLTC